MTDDMTNGLIGMVGVAATAGIGLATINMINDNMPNNKRRKKHKHKSNKN